MIENLKLKNWKVHENAEFNFSDGINVLVGNMGSGKSSILHAISFALFGTFLDLKKKDVVQTELITKNISERFCQVELKISDSEKEYNIQRKILEKGTNEAIIRDEKGSLVAGPNPTSVNLFVNDLLKADDEVFFRTVYSAQNEIDVLLKYSPKERKEKIDELMGLNKFDKARNNCIKLRNQIVKKKNDFESILTKINIELIKKDLESIKKELETTNNEKDYLKQEIETSELKEKEIIAKYSELREKFDSINKNLERKRILEEELNEIKNKLFSIPLEKNKEETLKEIDDIKLQLNLNKELLEKNEREKDEINSKLLEIEKSNFSIESRLNELIKKIESIENVKKKILEHNIKDLGLELNEIKKQRKEIEKIFNSINIEISNQREHLIELERAGSLCPVCEKELSENNKTKLVLSKKRIVAEKLQEQFNVKENLSEIEKREETLENIFKENRESLDEISNEEEYKTECNELKTKKQENNILKEQINSSVKQLLEKINYMKNKNEELNNKKEILSSTIHLIELKSKKEKSENSLLEINSFLEKNKDVITEIKNVENEKNEIIKKIQESKTKIQTIDNLIFEKQRAVSNLTREKELYNSQTQEIENLENKSKFLENLKNAIEITQKSLRDELILAVNEMMDSLWSQIYPYDKWQGIKLNVEEGDYILQIKDMQGNWSKVAGFASGGERMLASLAVRIAFSRVLAPGLGLLILDEPTHNLDDKAVETLVEIIKTKLSDLINQVFIVTHDERLAEAGDNVIRL